DVVAIGSDQNLYHTWLSQDAWSPAEVLAYVNAPAFNATPALVAVSPNELHIIGPSYDGNQYHKLWNGSVWTPAGWNQLTDKMHLPCRYRFSVDYIRVDTSRSLNSDTNTGQCSLAIGNWPTTLTEKGWPWAPKTQRQGDMGGTALNSGATNLMNFTDVTVELCESAIFNYTFMNSSDPPSVVESTLKQQGTQLADSGVRSAVNAVASGLQLTAVALGSIYAPVIG